MSASLIVTLIRLVAPVAILRWPFWGALGAVVADTFDFTILNVIGNGPLGGENYQRFDKLFDVYTLFFFLYAASKIDDVRVRKILTVLFSWRILGVFAFEATGIRQFLFFAPNIFEYFYLLVFGVKQFKLPISLDDRKSLAVLFLIAAVPKIVLEYVMHFREHPFGLGSIYRAIKSWIGL